MLFRKSPKWTADVANVGERKSGIEHVQSFLMRYGYLEEGVCEPDHLDEETSAAIVKYQSFHRLPATGNFDDATRNQMAMARCALPDLSQGIEFSTTCRWTKWSLCYAFQTGTSDCVGEFQAIRKAFKTWAAAVPLTFTEVALNASPDIVIDWRAANDLDLSADWRLLHLAMFPLWQGG